MQAAPSQRLGPSLPGRLDSVDALRGLTVAAMIFVNDPGNWSHLWWPFAHADWHGCTPTDLIFPTFLFIVGVSLALAGGPRLDAGVDVAPLQRAWFWRALRILLLGWVLSALIGLSFGTHWRPLGVLQRIAICFGLVGWLYLHVSPRARWSLWAALLAGYGLLLNTGEDLGRHTSLPSRLDATLLGPLAYRYDPATGLGYEPEGLLSTLGALATTLFGAACGDWLRRSERRLIVFAGVAAAFSGIAVHALWQPMNKALWTPAFMLFTGGVAALVLVLLHTAIDRHGAPPFGRRFGVNAITAYAGSMLMVCAMYGVKWDGRSLHARLYETGFGWMVPHIGAEAASHAWALLQVAFWWAVLRWMDARRIRISI
ncbi:MAG TPA: heparan-alpha-glucosaminide N-acetyltransferase domain-containing protein [Ideonella sp.]|uniref:acyltransferase family protein n=1 Tax=Ideonella sp. TaxID=1929293 RepID=UPI002E320F56|nr:heparan-alpha-glucosaminide N-acetyltransferase domain-containing protein [Ideonella sp.]HEX5685418.1 heparan-alpha-glucosaminide N-acetyltransferase domain-containing protein [Ideonella sp.]